MTPESLSKEIARLSGELKRLNGLRMANAPYRVRSRNVERLIIEHAEHIARLQNFLSHMRTKEIVDWMLDQSVKASTEEKLQEQPENAP